MKLERNKAGKLKLSRPAFTVEYKAEVIRHKKAENLSFVETGKKSELSKLKLENAILKKQRRTGWCAD